MTLSEFIVELRRDVEEISPESIRAELTPLLDEGEMAGLDKKLKVALNKLIEFLEQQEAH